MRLAGRERLGFYLSDSRGAANPQIPTISGALFGRLTLASGGWRVRGSHRRSKGDSVRNELDATAGCARPLFSG